MVDYGSQVVQNEFLEVLGAISVLIIIFSIIIINIIYFSIYIYIYKDSSASFSSSLCSKFVKIIVNNQGRLRKKKPTRMVTPPFFGPLHKEGDEPG